MANLSKEAAMLVTADLDEGDAAYSRGDLDRALAIYEAAVDQAPNELRVRYNYGILLRDLERALEAEEQFEQAIRIDPKNADVFSNLGIVQEQTQQYGRAVGSYRAAISLNPEFAQAQFNLGMLLLRLGEFEEGFARSEWRWKTSQFTKLDCPHPKWDGSYLEGTLLVHTEQGAGDAIQFARYLPLAAEHCDRILFVCPDRLMNLFSNIPGVAEFRTAGQFSIDSFRAYTPLLSLPFLAGTTLQSIPDVPDFLAPSSGIPLPEHPKGEAKLKVGISWAGSPTHSNDKNRSTELRYFANLLSVEGVALYSLQVDDVVADLDEYAGQICSLKEEQGSWADAAALVEQLDLVICVDTGVAHLSASLGVPTWIALSQKCDWRWMLEREDSPWYPSMRLFRQPSSGDWDSVFEEIEVALRALADQSDPNREVRE